MPHAPDRGVRVLLRSLLAAALLIGLSGCGNDAGKLMDSAREYIAKGDGPAAVIQLRNVLQQTPEHGEARLLLGGLLLQQGDVLGAEKELRRALDYGQSATAVVPKLAETMLAMGQADALIKEFGGRQLDSPSAQASLRASVGDAQLRAGRIAQARAEYDAALSAQPGFAPARLGQAVLALYDGQRDMALAITDELLASDAQYARAHALRADLLLAQGDAAGAKQALQRALDADPGMTVARLALASQLIEERDFDAAAQQVAAGIKASRGDARLVLLDATIALRKNDRAAARSKVQQVLKVAPEHAPSLFLAGQIELADGNLASAQQHLRSALSRAPGHQGARRALTAAYLSAGQPARAMETLQPLLADIKSGDPRLLMLAGETFLASGDVKQATDFFSRASAGEAVKASAQMRLGQIALASGDPDAGMRQLESAAAIEGSGHQADLALIAAHLRRGELAKATAAARDLEKKQPQNPLSHHMLGVVATAAKDMKAARSHFETAVERSPTYLPSVAALASLDLADKRPEDARKRFQDVIARDPKNELGYLGLADVQSRTGAAQKDISDTIDRAVAANPQAVQARVAQVNLLLTHRDAKGALAAAQAALNALPDEARIVEALARAQEASGEYNQATETLQRLAKLQPESPQPLLQLAALHAKNRQFDRALDTLGRARRIAPDNVQVQAAVASMTLQAGRPEEALKEVKSLQAKSPKLAVAYSLESDIHAFRKDWPQAERAAREAVKLDPSNGFTAVKLHLAQTAIGNAALAEATARKWLVEHPRDQVVRMHLADVALRQKNYKAAMGLYQEIVAIAPSNMVALNNLAWAAGELGDARALDYAEQALKLAPNSASILDTVGVLHIKRGDAKKGITFIERARIAEPGRADIQLSYAKALIALGQKDAARKELEALAQRQDAFAGKEGIAALLKSL
jgi:cellulose synthase operon protein C